MTADSRTGKVWFRVADWCDSSNCVNSDNQRDRHAGLQAEMHNAGSGVDNQRNAGNSKCEKLRKLDVGFRCACLIKSNGKLIH
ncbi:unnamed protein product [Mesocestoides corti]|uniref:SCP domain-containing protein n=1 Tax=Mesocestoides corti TaxID=53468 RepID=A0A0R3U1H2_MESCO|nr:unnamed protein product [Mesocestoides corti]